MASKKGARTRKGQDSALKRPEGSGLEEVLLERYTRAGIRILSDEVPRRLDPLVRAEMESITGADLSDVRLHTGEKAQKMADALGARAFAAGEKDVFFAPGELAMDQPEGKALLAHELTHVAEGHIGLARRHTKPEAAELEARSRRAERLVLAEEEKSKKEKQKTKEDMIEPVELKVDESGISAESSEIEQVVDLPELEDKV